MVGQVAQVTEPQQHSASARPQRAEGELASTLRCHHTIPAAWQDIVGAVGLGSATAAAGLATLCELSSKHANAVWYALWRDHCASYFDLQGADARLSPYVPSSKGTRLFLLQTYCKLLLTTLSARYGFHTAKRPGLFHWTTLLPAKGLEALEGKIAGCLPAAAFSADPATSFSDFLSYAYQEMFPPGVRHLTGEYYTPAWLVHHVLDSLPTLSAAPARKLRILDPAAGSGAFLAHCIERLGASASAEGLEILGVDVNPVAVELCKATLAVARQLHKSAANFACSAILADTILDPFEHQPPDPSFSKAGVPSKVILEQTFITSKDWPQNIDAISRRYALSERERACLASILRSYLTDAFAVADSLQADLIVGNPPWMTWDALRPQYRDALAKQWQTSSLVTQKGWRARVAAGKTDISSLFVYRAAERHAAPDAAMAFVLPLSLFQSRHAGAGFRRFRAASGRPYKLVSVDDFSGIKVFPDAANRAAVASFSVDRPSCFPARFVKWSNGESRGHLKGVWQTCMPIDPGDEASPIVPIAVPLRGVGRSDYRARGGVNTGGANTILWLEVLERDGALARVRNIGASRRSRSPVREGWVEAEAVRPLLAGADVTRWSATPSRHIVMLYSVDQPKKALIEPVAERRYPKAFRFISSFRDELANRKEYHRWGGTGPFYEVYRVGPYTFSPIKVVWQHTGFRDRLRVAVIDDRDAVPTIPDQKVILIACDDIDEAHYICACLGSTFVASMLSRYLGKDASTHILDYVGVKRFSRQDTTHMRLAQLSRAAHRAVRCGSSPLAFEQQIDRAIRRLRGGSD